MVIDVLAHVPHCYTYADGEKIAALIVDALRRGDDAVVSFRGVSAVPSSFVNAAFVGLLDEFSVDTVRGRLRVVDSTKQINSLIKDQVQREAATRREAAYA